ncbi:TraB/GumN family protein [Caulobacter sp.]|uniref:TraB/GumN family protein n=1 Tax=Caulobacter sp. TaxID=78 RepID=UPI003BAAE889
MKFRHVALALGSVALAPTATLAQTVDDPQATVVETLVVNARLPGPAWWKVSDEDTTVYILGLPPSLPKGMAWDSSVLDNRLKGAFAYIKPPKAQAGLGDIPALLKLRKSLLAEHPLEDRSPQLAARLSKAWAATDPKKPNDWRDWKPLGAALFLGSKANKVAGLEDAEPERTIEKMARKNRIKIRASAVYKAVPILNAVARQANETDGLACLEEVLDDFDRGPEVDRQASRAWAEGRVSAALSGRRGPDRCSLLLPGVPAFIRKAASDDVAALSEALKTPGHAVAVYSMRGLVAQNGVLDQLRDRGYTVKTPADQ